MTEIVNGVLGAPTVLHHAVSGVSDLRRERVDAGTALG